VIGIEVLQGAGYFRLMSRQTVLALQALRESHRFVRGMGVWIGFRQCAVYYERPVRFAGRTQCPLRKKLGSVIDAITCFSIVPLRLAT